MRLFSYCIPVDDGAAPNPFWGVCTLAICKPKIRRVANIGDWVVGVGSKNVRGISYQNKLVYAMKVTDKLTMEEYDFYCKSKLTNKIPDLYNRDYRRNVGDNIYDYSNSEPKLRLSVHKFENRQRDLGGKYVLLSNHFYYFGDKAIEIREDLLPIVKQGQSHKSIANEPIKLNFVDWLERLLYEPNTLYGQPQYIIDFSKYENSDICISKC
jgi:hypothetical protein